MRELTTSGDGVATKTPTATTAKTAYVPDALHDKTKQPTAPAGSTYVWIPTDAPSGGIWSLHQNGGTGGNTNGSGNGNAGNGGSVQTRKVVSTNMISRGGEQILVTSYDDGTTSEQNYGVDPAITAQKQNWRTVGQNLLDQYGLGSLGDKYFNFLNLGYDNSSAMLALQTTDEWKQRFSANEARLKQGLPVLSPANYLATEESYKDVLINAGVDKSIYNDPLTLGKIMAQDVSPVEMKERLDAARTVLDNKDPFVTSQLQSRFGLTKGDMVLHMLDPNIAAPIIAQRVQSAQINAEAARQGLNVSETQADALAASGVTQSQAQQGFGKIGLDGQLESNLPGDTTGSVTQQDLINATFNNDAVAQQKISRVQQGRTAQFQEGGQFATDSKGVAGLGVAATQ